MSTPVTRPRPMRLQSFKDRRILGFVGRYVGMLYSAQLNCKCCNGTGWALNWEDHCLQRCPCTDPTEVITTSP